MRSPGRRRVVLGCVSVAVLVCLYTVASNAGRFVDHEILPEPFARFLRPDLLPPTQAIAKALVSLVTGELPPMEGHHAHPSGHVSQLVEQHVTLQGALLVSVLRVLFGVAVGGPLGILTGFVLGWNRTADDYLHPIYVLLRSIPSLALITYVMLWFGHGEAHLLIPIVYAVFTTVVIPTYHGVRDLADVYVRAARSLGAGGRLLFARVVLPAASPAVLSALRYSLIIAWMTTVGVEMLMGDDGIGHLLVGGGLWSSRLQIGVDPAVIIVGILALAATGYVMDAAARIVSDRMTFWARRRRAW
jgi:ABC-type nitrate/sulfonate/bicarbonate transport system permease component